MKINFPGISIKQWSSLISSVFGSTYSQRIHIETRSYPANRLRRGPETLSFASGYAQRLLHVSPFSFQLIYEIWLELFGIRVC